MDKTEYQALRKAIQERAKADLEALNRVYKLCSDQPVTARVSNIKQTQTKRQENGKLLQILTEIFVARGNQQIKLSELAEVIRDTDYKSKNFVALQATVRSTMIKKPDLFEQTSYGKFRLKPEYYEQLKAKGTEHDQDESQSSPASQP